MRVRDYLVLFALAALWGASFLFIRIAIAELSPLTLVGARFVVATLGLLLVLLGIFFIGRKTTSQSPAHSHEVQPALEQVSSEERTIS